MSDKEKKDINQIVTPFEVKVEQEQIDYDAIVKNFGSTPIDQSLLERFEKVTGQIPHPFLRRGLYFSHRDFNRILDLYEKKKPFYLFTGRGPSSGDMHIGHMVPFIFTAYMQKVFKCPLVIQINDDEKFFWKDVKLDDLNRLAEDNIREVLAFGFDPKRTFIFKNTEYIREMYPNICQIQKRVTFNQVKAIFGVTPSSSIGKIAFPAVQAAPSFSSTFKRLFRGMKIPCLILCAIDQDPYFRMTRDVAPRMKEIKPALLHCKFLPGLQGINTKMSASEDFSAIYLNDKPKRIRKKIGAAVSGGGETRELHRLNGADLKRDVPFEYLKFFLEDDATLAEVRQKYSCGQMETGEVKKLLGDTLVPLLEKLASTKKNVTDEAVEAFKAIRELEF